MEFLFSGNDIPQERVVFRVSENTFVYGKSFMMGVTIFATIIFDQLYFTGKKIELSQTFFSIFDRGKNDAMNAFDSHYPKYKIEYMNNYHSTSIANFNFPGNSKPNLKYNDTFFISRKT